jgi:5'-phosphate synthase pdxT subunit
LHAVFIRAPWVESVGPGVEVLASVPVTLAGLGDPGPGPVADGPAQHPVAVRQGLVLATSFHPEITADHRMHELFLRMVRDG